ncbi:MAG TPA: methyltransferase domain-containing protein [Pyrinomonadaceae bacterium]|jgi:SAM-dependent methyltransferase
MHCPLCNQEEARPSWLGSVLYEGREFPFVECLHCGTLYCEPMPDAEVLARMYGPDYTADCSALHTNVDNPKEPQRVIEWLGRESPGIFVDYGCGAGRLLTEAQKLKWEAVGVEFDDEVCAAVERSTGAKVFNSKRAQAALGERLADVLNLGDVVEHLTEVNRQMPEILRLLKPGGLLLAQGPLEGNANLFTLMLRLARTARRTRQTEMAPYHVMLATASGQREFFRRFGLSELEFSMSEVSWPAPSRLLRGDLKSPRQVGLFTARRLSQTLSRLRPGHWGNRYFYAGRKQV